MTTVSDPDFEGFDLNEDENTVPVHHRTTKQNSAPVYTGIPDIRMGIVQNILYKKINPALLDEEDERQFALNIVDVLIRLYLMSFAGFVMGMLALALVIILWIKLF